MRRAAAFALAVVTGLGLVGCSSDEDPTAAQVLCDRGRPDGHVDIKYLNRPSGAAPTPLFNRVLSMSRACCPNWKALAHGGKTCTHFAVFENPTGGNHAIAIDLGRTASARDRSVVLAFLRRYGSAHAV